MFKKVENPQFLKIKSALNYLFSEIAWNMDQNLQDVMLTTKHALPQQQQLVMFQ